MPTPNLYRNFSNHNLKYKWRYLGLCGIGLVVSALAVVVMLIIKINFVPILAIGIILEFWGIGFFFLIIGFEKKSKSKYKLIAIFRNIDDWGAAIFLNFWFLFSAVMSL
jgi:hypothetical protein